MPWWENWHLATSEIKQLVIELERRTEGVSLEKSVECSLNKDHQQSASLAAVDPRLHIHLIGVELSCRWSTAKTRSACTALAAQLLKGQRPQFAWHCSSDIFTPLTPQYNLRTLLYCANTLSFGTTCQLSVLHDQILHKFGKFCMQFGYLILTKIF